MVLIPLMTLGWGSQTKTAISAGLAIVLFTGIVGAAGYIATGFGDLFSLPPLIVASMVGAWLGGHLTDITLEAVIQRCFAIFMIVVAVRLLADATGIFIGPWQQ